MNAPIFDKPVYINPKRSFTREENVKLLDYLQELFGQYQQPIGIYLRKSKHVPILKLHEHQENYQTSLPKFVNLKAQVTDCLQPGYYSNIFADDIRGSITFDFFAAGDRNQFDHTATLRIDLNI